MPTANELRGEIAVTLEGIDYVMRPSYEAQVAIERQTGRSIRQLAEAAGEGAMSIEQASIIVCECVKAFGKASGDATLQAFNAQRVGEEIVTTGMLKVTPRLEILLFLAVTGGYDAKGERKAQAMNTTETPVDA